MRTRKPSPLANAKDDALPSDVLKRIVGGADSDDKQKIDSHTAVGLTAGAEGLHPETMPQAKTGGNLVETADKSVKVAADPSAKQAMPGDKSHQISNKGGEIEVRYWPASQEAKTGGTTIDTGDRATKVSVDPSAKQTMPGDKSQQVSNKGGEIEVRYWPASQEAKTGGTTIDTGDRATKVSVDPSAKQTMSGDKSGHVLMKGGEVEVRYGSVPPEAKTGGKINVATMDSLRAELERGASALPDAKTGGVKVGSNAPTMDSLRAELERGWHPLPEAHTAVKATGAAVVDPTSKQLGGDATIGGKTAGGGQEATATISVDPTYKPPATDTKVSQVKIGGVTLGFGEVGVGPISLNVPISLDIKLPPAGGQLTPGSDAYNDALKEGRDMHGGKPSSTVTLGSKDSFNIEGKYEGSLDVGTGGFKHEGSIEGKSTQGDKINKQIATDKAAGEQKAYDEAVKEHAGKKAAYDAAQDGFKRAETNFTKADSEHREASKALGTSQQHFYNAGQAVNDARTDLQKKQIDLAKTETDVMRAIYDKDFDHKARTSAPTEAQKKALVVANTAHVDALAQYENAKNNVAAKQGALTKAGDAVKEAEKQLTIKQGAVDKAQDALQKAKSDPALAKPPGEPPAKPAAPKPVEAKPNVITQMVGEMKKNAWKDANESVNNIQKGLSKQDAKDAGNHTKVDETTPLLGGVSSSTETIDGKQVTKTHIGQIVTEKHTEDWTSGKGSGSDNTYKIVGEVGDEEVTTYTDADGNQHVVSDKTYGSYSGTGSFNKFDGPGLHDGKGGGRVDADVEHTHKETVTTKDGQKTTDTSYERYHGATGVEGSYSVGGGGFTGTLKAFFEHIVEKGFSKEQSVGQGLFSFGGKLYAQVKGEAALEAKFLPDPLHGKFQAGFDMGGQIDSGVGLQHQWSAISGKGNGIKVTSDFKVGSIGAKAKPNIDYDNGKVTFSFSGSYAEVIGVGGDIKLVADVDGYKEGLGQSWDEFKANPADAYEGYKEQYGNPVLAAGLTVAAKIPLVAAVSAGINGLFGAFA